jgi:hypothetical protein
VVLKGFPALLADAPDAAHRDELMLFGQFVGEWRFEGIEHDEDGSRTEDSGEIHFAWILGGRAVQDVWTERESGDGKLRPFGTTLRFYDPEIQRWRITWVSPEQNAVKLLTGGKVGDEIVLEGNSPDGTPIRWIFSQIEPASFRWRGERKRGSEWHIREELSAHRKS